MQPLSEKNDWEPLSWWQSAANSTLLLIRDIAINRPTLESIRCQLQSIFMSILFDWYNFLLTPIPAIIASLWHFTVSLGDQFCWQLTPCLWRRPRSLSASLFVSPPAPQWGLSPSTRCLLVQLFSSHYHSLTTGPTHLDHRNNINHQNNNLLNSS